MENPKLKDQFRWPTLMIWILGFIAITIYIFVSDIFPNFYLKLIVVLIVFVAFIFNALKTGSRFHLYALARDRDSRKQR